VTRHASSMTHCAGSAWTHHSSRCGRAAGRQQGWEQQLQPGREGGGALQLKPGRYAVCTHMQATVDTQPQRALVEPHHRHILEAAAHLLPCSTAPH